MAKTKVLFIAGCIGADQFHHQKGTVMEFDDEKKSDVPTLAALKAGGRIVPLTKENCERCIGELEKKKVEIKLSKEETDAGVQTVQEALDELNAEAEKAVEKKAKK